MKNFINSLKLPAFNRSEINESTEAKFLPIISKLLVWSVLITPNLKKHDYVCPKKLFLMNLYDKRNEVSFF